MVHHGTIPGMDGIPQHHLTSADDRLAEAARSIHEALPALNAVMAEFGQDYQIEMTPDCIVAVKRPTPTVQEITTGRTPEELLAKLRTERDGTS
jgi:hypothetical protein